MGHKIGYARCSTADRTPNSNSTPWPPRLPEDVRRHRHRHQDRPTPVEGMPADLRPGDTLVIWKVDRLGRNLRDSSNRHHPGEAGCRVKSLTNGHLDTTTARATHLRHVRPQAEYEAALIAERTHAGLAAARARGRTGGRKPKMTGD